MRVCGPALSHRVRYHRKELGIVIWVIAGVWAFALGLVFWAMTRLFPSNNRKRAPGSAGGALEILSWRYARGELSRGEFECIKQDIQNIKVKVVSK